MRRLPVIGLLLLFAAGCSAPPQNEIDQAQGTIDAARAAGADKYAPDEYSAATASLQKAHDAVNQRDYRQALSYAIDARERGQDAARAAADGKARARGRVEALVSQLSARSQQLDGRITAAAAARVPARDLKKARATLAECRSSLQEARTTIEAGNYQEAMQALAAVGPKLDAAIKDVQAMSQRPARRRR